MDISRFSRMITTLIALRSPRSRRIAETSAGEPTPFSFTRTITSPAFNPAFSAGDPLETARISTPCFTPKNSAKPPFKASASTPSDPLRQDIVARGISGMVARDISGIVARGTPLTPLTPGIAGITTARSPGKVQLLRWATLAVRVCTSPLRLTCSFASRPTGISRTIRTNCSTPSTRCPFISSTTSPFRRPARPAGESSSTAVTSTPRSSFSFSSRKRPASTSCTPMPR